MIYPNILNSTIEAEIQFSHNCVNILFILHHFSISTVYFIISRYIKYYCKET